MSESTCIIDGFGPLPVVQPASVAELAEIVRRAAQDGKAIYPLGGQTMLHVGLPPTKPGIGVDLRRLDQVIDYPARDMTITVQAGITIAKLQEMLQQEGQHLPVDVPLPEKATLGGALATNVSGPRRYGYGTLRDYVIGISVINDEGQEVKAGGRVVKNVAGYDMCKLYIGSFGTLGIISQVTLKVKPRPQHRMVVSWPCPAEQLEEMSNRLHQSRTRPVCVSALKSEKGWHIIVGFDGVRTSVNWQVQQLRQEMADQTKQLTAEETSLWLPILAEFTSPPLDQVVFKANLLPGATAAFCRQSGELSEMGIVRVHLGNGIVIGHVAGDVSLETTRVMLKPLQEAAAAAQGNLTILRCPPEWKKSLLIWGQPRGDVWLMRAIKDKLDPRRIFNPGRFVDGI